MIRVYPSKIDGDPIEQHKIRKQQSILAWLEELSGTTIDLEAPQPISVEIDGVIVPVEQWCNTLILLDDEVRITFEAKGGVVRSVGNFISNAINRLFSVFVRKPAVNVNVQQSKSQRQDAKDIETATLRANRSNPNELIPERFGLNRVYPDYLVPNHSYFVNNEQVTEMLLSVGYGSYSVPSGQIYIGETPVISLDDASVNVFQPGQTITNSTFNYWHLADEVGGTSTGNSGLKLGTTSNVATTPDSQTFAFNNNIISIPAGAGSFPAWQSGMYVRVYRFTEVQFIDVSGQSAFIGPINNIPFVSGDEIEIAFSSNDASTFFVDQVTGNEITLKTATGDPVTWLPTGTHSVSIGYRGHLFLITGIQSGDNPSWISVSMIDDNNDEVTAWNGFDSRTTIAADLLLDASNVASGWTGPFMAIPADELATVIEYDILFPNGLVRFNSSDPNKTSSITFNYEVSYRDAALLGEWTTVQRSVTARSVDQYAITRTINLPYPMRPQVRMRRIGAESTSAYIKDVAEWYSLKSKIDAPNHYDEVTAISVIITTGEKISAQTENKIWCYATRQLAPYDAPDSPIRPTRSIADAFGYLARKMGYRTDQIDMQRLGLYHATWESRGDHFDHSYTSATTLKRALNDVLGVGFAEMVTDRGQIVPVRDEPRTQYDHVYTPQNMRSDVQQFIKLRSLQTSDEFDGIDVEYLSLATGELETVECRLPGDTGIKVQTIQAVGITDKSRAWRWGMRQRRLIKYRRKQFKFSTGFDAFNSSYLDYCTITDNYSDYGQSAQVVAYEEIEDGQLYISVDQPLSWIEDAENIVLLRRPDGTASGPYIASTGLDEFSFIIDAPDFNLVTTSDTIEATHVAFGVDTRAFYPVLVESIKTSGSPMGESEPLCTVTAWGYAPEVYLDDNNNPP
ncbi:hypothetical protein HOP61_19690 [Halomonas daqingensis]|uniref:Tip attachment protein J HDII-ins2 domain-containing protein n=1 Tax=Billgrantia desiderata TaxID=52021 RepID=A0AAW4YZN8_9GAMM|nr:host specificity factor TipJ family phage tail protein [Halomonas desiderata]MCE8053520.1 hypothetical protein [Halomonas desiderata]